ncbi:MAG: dienelactone hydrolase family protein [Gemmatimonadota bacterium]|nr:dienelactone hydrolase family protein [Gemmatimonadota bacterium]
MVLQWAADLRAIGHVVHAPDLYDGEVFDTMTRAAEWLQPIGFDGVLARAAAAVSTLPREVVYAGFSNGGACAELLAETREGARGAILMHAPLPIRVIRRAIWPAGVPVQVHFSQRDPLRSQAVIETLGAHVRAAPAEFQDFTYAGGGHLFSDPGQSGYDAASAMLMWTRVTDFLERIARPPTESGILTKEVQ